MAGKLWPDEKMWKWLADLRRSGLTFAAIEGQLSKPENLERFQLKDIPGYDTIRREVNRRLLSEDSLVQTETMDSILYRPGHQFQVWPGGGETLYVRAISVEPVSASGHSVMVFGSLQPGELVCEPLAEKLHLEVHDLVRYRLEVLENIAITLTGKGSHCAASAQHWVDPSTPEDDPGAWFWLYGGNREIQICARNTTGYRMPMNRVRFSGWRMTIQETGKPEGGVIHAITRPWR